VNSLLYLKRFAKIFDSFVPKTNCLKPLSNCDSNSFASFLSSLSNSLALDRFFSSLSRDLYKNKDTETIDISYKGEKISNYLFKAVLNSSSRFAGN
jgi:hypothetical protein